MEICAQLWFLLLALVGMLFARGLTRVWRFSDLGVWRSESEKERWFPQRDESQINEVQCPHFSSFLIRNSLVKKLALALAPAAVLPECLQKDMLGLDVAMTDPPVAGCCNACQTRPVKCFDSGLKRGIQTTTARIMPGKPQNSKQ